MPKIKVKSSNDRIDKYLSIELDKSREEVSKMIDSNFVLVNGKKVKNSYKVKENDEIEITDFIDKDIEIKPEKMDLNIVYEDDDIIVIDKPSGLVVHPGSGINSNTLVNGLMYYTKCLSDINGKNRPGIVHRIDKDTSGLILVAKNNSSHEILSEMFKNKKIKREYIAIVNGVIPHEKITIDAPIGRNKVSRKTMTVTPDNSKNAVTHLSVLKRGNEHTLVSLVLETGRTHQIRVHMKYIGYPVYNDPVYSNKTAGSFGQYLHSYKMEFLHPITNDNMKFISELPKEFEEFIKDNF